MNIYMAVFIILSLFTFIENFSDVSTKLTSCLIFFILIFYIFLSTFYIGEIGDYYSYKDVFFNATESTRHFEVLYLTISRVIRTITCNYVVLRFILALFVMGLWGMVYTEKYGQAKFYPFTMIWITWALNFGGIFVVRSSIAVVVCLYSIRFIINKEIKKYIYCLLIAIGFHTMAVLWGGAYFIYWLKPKFKKYLYICLIVSIIFPSLIKPLVLKISLYMGSYIHNRILNYMAYGNVTYGSSYSSIFLITKALANMLVMVIAFEFILRNRRRNNNIQYEYGLLNLYLFGAIIYIISFQISIALGRAALPYTSVQFILLAQVLDISGIKKYISIKIVGFLIMFLYLFLRLYVTVNSGSYLPFRLKI